ncbi:MAG: hypothetical protein HY692_08160 [Cyanobacteria bacterium NC_groundwater_1444_Ag_S-0.65um_54_12]|nr:hypothetical protein [Cyanobacteria bacterium NC_groundwater_1444_Ag_S-0.65um_54_12]
MSAIAEFSAQVRKYLPPAPPTWPDGTTVHTAQPGQPARAAEWTWYAIPRGNPDRLTVLQLVKQAYRFDARQDPTKIKNLASYVAQVNGLVLHWSIPPTVTGLWLPRSSAGTTRNNPVSSPSLAPDNKYPAAINSRRQPVPVKKERSTSELVANIVSGIAALAAGVGRIIERHSRHSAVETNYDVLGKAKNRDVDIVVQDVADAAPIVANLGALLGGNPPPLSSGLSSSDSWPGYDRAASSHDWGGNSGSWSNERSYNINSGTGWGQTVDMVTNSIGSLVRTIGSLWGR